ncbi:uncharacterized protein LOC119881393 [Canis lupus familiaris]|uniref:uncharacterized protein LOC119881393 n=1 Tax=Canis lupus familiaris TaxID=9615 RepID=UPI0018F7D6F1|nr:uncharacterized protein LOC119881393 [Canis lupus familiaris]
MARKGFSEDVTCELRLKTKKEPDMQCGKVNRNKLRPGVRGEESSQQAGWKQQGKAGRLPLLPVSASTGFSGDALTHGQALRLTFRRRTRGQAAKPWRAVVGVQAACPRLDRSARALTALPSELSARGEKELRAGQGKEDTGGGTRIPTGWLLGQKGNRRRKKFVFNQRISGWWGQVGEQHLIERDRAMVCAGTGVQLLSLNVLNSRVGDAIPSVIVFEGEPGNKVNLAELFKGKKGVLFGVPRSFSPGCSKTHLPGFMEQAEALKAKGVQVIACLSVNDVFVTEAWGRAHNSGGKVKLLADPTGAFGKETDLLLDDSLVSLFGNHQLKRFSMVIENGIVKSLNVEPDGTGLTCSLAPNILSRSECPGPDTPSTLSCCTCPALDKGPLCSNFNEVHPVGIVTKFLQ